jgi:hypothetical protein
MLPSTRFISPKFLLSNFKFQAVNDSFKFNIDFLPKASVKPQHLSSFWLTIPTGVDKKYRFRQARYVELFSTKGGDSNGLFNSKKGD